MSTASPPNQRPAFSWDAQLRLGASGMETVIALLEERGHRVVDLSKVKSAQGRDVDLIVGEELVEVKTDTHPPSTVFLEVVCDGKPGCLWKSRADCWYYYFPADQTCYRLDLPKLQWFVAQHLTEYPAKTVTSRRNQRRWQAQGIVVPVQTLLDASIASPL